MCDCIGSVGGTGACCSLADTLAVGNESGGTDLFMTVGDSIITNSIVPHDASLAHQGLMIGGQNMPGPFQQYIQIVGSNVVGTSIGSGLTVGGGSSLAGGVLSLDGGSAFVDGVAAGEIMITGGQRRDIPTGGNVNLTAGTSVGTAPNGDVVIRNGNAQRAMSLGDAADIDAAAAGYVATLDANKSLIWLPPSVQGVFSVGPAPYYRFQTIQSAITAAVAAGASYANPFIIDIMAGKYTENLVVQGGGIFLRGCGGVGVSAGTVLTGTIDWQIPATLDCFYGAEKLRVSLEQTLSGDTTATSVVFYANSCDFRRQFAVPTTAKAQIYDNGSQWRHNAADVILATTLSVVSMVNSQLLATSGAVRCARFTGFAQLANLKTRGLLQMATSSASSITGGFYEATVTAIEAAHTSTLYLSHLFLLPTTAVSPALLHSGAGTLYRNNVVTIGTATAPVFVNSGVGVDVVGIAV